MGGFRKLAHGTQDPCFLINLFFYGALLNIMIALKMGI